MHKAMISADNLPVYHVPEPSKLPARVAYVIGGGLMPDLPDRPDMPPPEAISIEGVKLGRHRTDNGLTARADAMARWVASGATLNDAYRATYKPRANATPNNIGLLAYRIAAMPAWQQQVAKYREEHREKHSQTGILVGDFVKGRLVLEAQDAPQASARLTALKLLGQTEGMFTTVHKTERTLDPAQLASLKDKLEQRLRDAMARLSGLAVPPQGPSLDPSEAGTGDAGPHGPGTPLSGHGSPPDPAYTNPPTGSPRVPVPPDLVLTGSLPDLTLTGSLPVDAGPPVSLGSPLGLGPSAAGSASICPAVPAVDPGYLEEFDGPLVLRGGLREV